MSRKSREVGRVSTNVGSYNQYNTSGGLIDHREYHVDYAGFEELTSYGHRWPPRKGQFGDVGGPLLIRKYLIKHDPADISKAYTLYDNGRTARDYSGSLRVNTHINFRADDDNLYAAYSDLSSTNFGVKAWSKFKPTAPKGSLGQAIAELHDVKNLFDLPKIYSGLKFFKTLGKEYLRQEFGWKPFINDVKDFCKNVYNADDRMRQLVRDNGRNIRRRGNLSSTNTTSTSSSRTYFMYPKLATALWAGEQTYTKTERFSETKTFSGSFKYWIPAINGEGSYAQKQQLTRIAYGLDLSPSLVWNLMPWSWLVDWFGNIGANLDNLNDNQDNLTAMYAYLMQSKTRITEHTCTGKIYQGPIQASFSAKCTVTETLKQRTAASPFGFGISIPDLSLRQKAILGALGVSRLL